MLMEKSLTDQINQLDLPWDKCLADWPDHLLKAQNHGFANTTLVCVERGGVRYLVLELPESDNACLDTLHAMEEYGLPVMPAVRVVHECQPGFMIAPLGDDLMTLSHCLAMVHDDPTLLKEVHTALAHMLAHLHLGGFHWNQNTTPEILLCHENDQFKALIAPPLGGQLCSEPDDLRRAIDIQQLIGVVESAAMLAIKPADLTQLSVVADIAKGVMSTYRELWSRFSDGSLFSEEQFHLALEPDQVESTHLVSVNLSARVISRKPHQLMLHMLTGLDARESRTPKLLQEIFRYQAWLEFSSGRKWSRALAANRWMNDVYMPAVKALPLGVG